MVEAGGGAQDVLESGEIHCVFGRGGGQSFMGSWVAHDGAVTPHWS